MFQPYTLQTLPYIYAIWSRIADVIGAPNIVAVIINTIVITVMMKGLGTE